MLKLKPGFAQDRVTDGPDMQISQWLCHVWGEDDQVHPESQGEREKRIPERSKRTWSQSCWSKELVQIFLSDFVRVRSRFSKIVDKPLK